MSFCRYGTPLLLNLVLTFVMAAEIVAHLQAEIEGGRSQIESLRGALSTANQQLIDLHADLSSARQATLTQTARASETVKNLQVSQRNNHLFPYALGEYNQNCH